MCGTKSQCAIFQSLVKCLGQFLRPINGPPGAKVNSLQISDKMSFNDVPVMDFDLNQC